MSEFSSAAELAISYLKDIDRDIKNLSSQDNYLMREDEAKKIIAGDLQLARNECRNLDTSERQVIEAECYKAEGELKWSVADGYSEYNTLPDHRRARDRYCSESAEAYQKAINLFPKPYYYFQLGTLCFNLGRKSEAAFNFQKATEGDDPEIAIKARKELGRLGPVKSTPTTSTSSGTSEGGFVRKKQPQWGLVVKGGIALAIGLVLSTIIIGIPIALWGIFLIAKGFIVQVDV